ncbi:CarD family transcriptional regulator [Acidobacteriota bacterium]
MNGLKAGEKVIYPNQGIGIVEKIQNENYFGESFRIFHVRILANDTLVLVPSSNAQEIGIRRPISEGAVEKIFKLMSNGIVDVTMNWKGRYKEHVNLMKSGQMLDMVLVLKSLYYLNMIKPLSFREKKMMEKAKDLIVTEISEVSEAPFDSIEEKIMDSLSVCFKDIVPRFDS